MPAAKKQGEEKDVLNFEEDICNEENVPESAWFKFNAPGDKIQGALIGLELKKSKDVKLPDQRVFTLRLKDGFVMNVGIAVNKDYIIQRTNNINLETHDYMIGFEFKKEVPSSLGKSYASAKSIEVYIKKAPKAPAPADL